MDFDRPIAKHLDNLIFSGTWCHTDSQRRASFSIMQMK
jgi:hypothetical protein